MILSSSSFAQNAGRLAGSLEANGNFFIRDSAIGADNTPQYDNQLIGSEVWLNLTYSNWGFDIGVRMDLFNNSNLLNPQDSYTDQGIGRWFIKKKINKLKISVGYLYDQIGSGIIFRAYEQRPLLIDNALYGARLVYDFSPDWQVKVFRGKQKRQFDVYDPILTGANIEGFYAPSDTSSWSIAPGIGTVVRTFDQASMDKLVNVISGYNPDDQFKPQFNVYTFSLYNTLSAGPFSWYMEYALKSDDSFYNPFAPRRVIGGTVPGKFVKGTGSVAYTTLSYAKKGLGITLEAKRTENFSFRADIFQQQIQGLISFNPPMFRQNTYRLTARYSPVTQDIGELAFTGDIRYSPNRKLSFLINGSYIDDLEGKKLYREVFTEITYKMKRKWQLLGGVQYQDYNQNIYLGKATTDPLVAITPYLEFLYKIDRKKSVRAELQYMDTDEDFGSWVFALVEFGIAPHWFFEVSDMYNLSPNAKNESIPEEDNGEKKKIHYPSVGVVYSNKSNRFSLRYVKQVEGIVCSGGICRLEPAFSGFRLSVTSTF